MKTVFSFFATFLFTANALTQTSAELTCRAQAKELAMQTYSTCITQARNQQVEKIRKNYKKELSDLKSKYDNELKKIGGKTLEKPSQAVAPTKSIPKTLPPKVVTSETVSIQDVPTKAKVVAVDTQESSVPANTEAEDADPVEIIEMPTE